MNENIVAVAGLHFKKAGWPRRIGARSIDILFLSAICFSIGRNFLPLTVPLSIICLFIGNGLLGGRSIGKRLTGLKVIDAQNGRPITPVQDFVRQRYLFFTNPIFLLLTVFDSSQGYFDKPETFVVLTTPVPASEIVTPPLEKPAKLDLEAMRKSIMERPK